MKTQILPKLVYGKRNKLTISFASEVMTYDVRINRDKSLGTRTTLVPYLPLMVDRPLMEIYKNPDFYKDSGAFEQIIESAEQRIYPNETEIEISNEILTKVKNFIRVVGTHIIENPGNKMRKEGMTISFYSDNGDELYDLGLALSNPHINLAEYDFFNNLIVNLYKLPENVNDGEIVLSPRMKNYTHKITTTSNITKEFVAWCNTNKEYFYFPKSLEYDMKLVSEGIPIYYGNRYFYTKNEKMPVLLKMSFTNVVRKVEKIIINNIL